MARRNSFGEGAWGLALDMLILLFAVMTLAFMVGWLEGAPRKIEPEPPAKTLAGKWEGVWGGVRFTAILSADGSYSEDYGGRPYAGRWKHYKETRVLEISEDQVPVLRPCLYSLRVSRCRRKAGTSAAGEIRMWRKGR